jgi:hypothetical protein
MTALKKYLPHLALLLWFFSLWLPGLVNVENPGGSYAGGACLVLGWMGFGGKPAFAFLIPWLANIPMLFGFVFGLKNKSHLHARNWMLASLIMSLPVFLIQGIPRNEGGVGGDFPVTLGAGGYLWLASQVLMLITVQLRLQKNA